MDNRNIAAGAVPSAESISINDLPGMADIGKPDNTALGNHWNAGREVFVGTKEEMFDPENFLSQAEKEIIEIEITGGVPPEQAPRDYVPAPARMVSNDEQYSHGAGMSALQRKILGI